MPSLPLHIVTAEWKEDGIDTRPGKQYPKVEPKTMSAQIKQYRATAFDYLMQWPRISPVVEMGFEVNVVE